MMRTIMHGASPCCAAVVVLSTLGLQAVQAGKPFDAKPCFRNEFEAGAIASQFLANFQRDVQRSRCENDKIFEVYKDNFAEDVTFKAFGEVRIPGSSGKLARARRSCSSSEL